LQKLSITQFNSEYSPNSFINLFNLFQNVGSLRIKRFLEEFFKTKPKASTALIPANLSYAQFQRNIFKKMAEAEQQLFAEVLSDAQEQLFNEALYFYLLLVFQNAPAKDKQLIPAQFSYSQFQQSMFAKSQQESPDREYEFVDMDDDFDLIEKSEACEDSAARPRLK